MRTFRRFPLPDIPLSAGPMQRLFASAVTFRIFVMESDGKIVKKVAAVLLFVGVTCCRDAVAQGAGEELYYPFETHYEAFRPELESDSLLFYRAIQQSDDLFAELAAYRFAHVSWHRRGEGYDESPVLMDGVRLSWRYLTALRQLQVGSSYRKASQLPAGGFDAGAGVTVLSLTQSDPVPEHTLAMRLATRNYRAGLQGTLSFERPDGWMVSATVDGRSGRDLLVDGVYTRQLTAALRLVRRRPAGDCWALFLAAPLSERGLRSASVEEAYTLRGSTCYNPAWGRQSGRVRNSRVRRETVPAVVASYATPTDRPLRIRTSGSVETGIRRQSGLGWYDASTPRPDNYHYLPSYFSDAGEAFEAVDAAWRSGDERYTQIDWDELYLRNRLYGGEALYTLEDRVERPLRVQAAAELEADAGPRLTVRASLHVDCDAPRYYKQLRDLLGADHLTDIDRFLMDDATYSNSLQNDLRHPDRTVRDGDRFGYDYRLNRFETFADVAVHYRADRLSVSCGVRIGHAVMWRHGYYEKELFPGSGSYGSSDRLHFTPYVLRASAAYAFTARNCLELSAHAVARTPDVENLFLQPLYNNRAVDNPQAVRRYGVGLDYVHAGRMFDMQAAGYLTVTRGESETSRFYDDLGGEYCDMHVRGIGRFACGVETAMRLRLTWNWSLSAAIAAGHHVYAANPSVWLYTDAGNDVRAAGTTSYVSGLKPSGAAAFAATAGVRYFGNKGWYFSADASTVCGRGVAPSFHYRTSRVANQASDSPETFALFTGQTALDDSFVVDVSAGRMWRMGASRLSVTLSVRNLLDDRQTLYSAYESDRVRRLRAGAETFYRPFAASLLYAGGRSAVLTVSYKF